MALGPTLPFSEQLLTCHVGLGCKFSTACVQWALGHQSSRDWVFYNLVAIIIIVVVVIAPADRPQRGQKAWWVLWLGLLCLQSPFLGVALSVCRLLEGVSPWEVVPSGQGWGQQG